MKKILFSFLIALFLQYGGDKSNVSGSSGGKVAFLNTNTVVTQPSTTSFSSSTFTVDSGPNQVCFVPVLAGSGGVTAVSLNGTSIFANLVGKSSNGDLSIFYEVNATAGSSQTLAITANASQIAANVVCFTGVNQTTPVRSGTFAQGPTNLSMTITSNANDLTMSLVAESCCNITGTNQTSNGYNNSGAYAVGSDHATTGASSVTHTWSVSGTPSGAIIGFSIQHN
jgi:hypothetical protein